MGMKTYYHLIDLFIYIGASLLVVIPEFQKIAKILYTHLHRKKWYSKVMY